jgi:hypothetical protein
VANRLSALRDLLKSLIPRLRPYGPVTAITLIAILLGFGGYTYVESRSTDGRIVIGNTAGSLTAIVEYGDDRVMIGAGPTRAHAADLLGRSTVPWDRSVDLLIIPGWDDFHATGALGLLERHAVRDIAVIGIPGEDPIWTLLEREAQEQDVAIRFFDREQTLELDDNIEFMFASGSHEAAGTWVQLLYGGALIQLADTTTTSHPVNPALPWASDPHVFIAMRSGTVSSETPARVLVQPEPFIRHEIEDLMAEYVADIPRNERLELTLDEGTIRLPLDSVRF